MKRLRYTFDRQIYLQVPVLRLFTRHDISRRNCSWQFTFHRSIMHENGRCCARV